MERENSPKKMTRSLVENTQTHGNLRFLAITDVFLDQKRVNVCEHTVKMAPSYSF